MLNIRCKGGLPSTGFGIRGQGADLGDGGCFRGWECDFGICEPIWSFCASKCSEWKIGGGCDSHIWGFGVAERIWETGAVSGAESVTLAFVDQFGRFVLQGAHNGVYG